MGGLVTLGCWHQLGGAAEGDLGFGVVRGSVDSVAIFLLVLLGWLFVYW